MIGGGISVEQPITNQKGGKSQKGVSFHSCLGWVTTKMRGQLSVNTCPRSKILLTCTRVAKVLEITSTQSAKMVLFFFYYPMKCNLSNVITHLDANSLATLIH